MKLTFSNHLSARTSSSYSLKIYPSGKQEEFLVQREDREKGEGMASTCTYDFPDDSVVVASLELGPSVADPDDRGDLTIEVHVGPEAGAEIAEAAESEAREMAAEAGVLEVKQNTHGYDGFPGFSGFLVIRH